MNAKNAALLLLVPTLALALAGCRKREDTDQPGGGNEDVSSDEQALVSDGADMEEASSRANELSALPTIALAGRSALRADEAADAQAEATPFFQPEGCLTIEREANVVTYTFDACTGPWGLVELNGQEIATFTDGPEEGSIAITLQSKDLEANAHPIDHQADVLVSFPDESSRRVAWKGGFTTASSKGTPIAHTSDLVFTVDAQDCRTANGVTTGSVGDRGITVTYEELTRCGGRNMCPAGSVTAENKAGLTTSIEFDGSDTAVVTGPRGREWEVPMLCQAM